MASPPTGGFDTGPERRLWLAILVSAALHFALVSSATFVTPAFEAPQPLQVELRRADDTDPASMIGAAAPSDTAAPAASGPSAQQARPRPDSVPTPLARRPLAFDLPFERYFSSREVDVRAEQKNEVALVYPKSAYEMRLRGTVRLRLFINEQGTLDDVQLIEATPPGIFDAHALAAARTLEFRPAVKDGRNVKSRKLIEVSFDPYESINIP